MVMACILISFRFNRSARLCPDPVISHCRSDQCFGALPEKILDVINSFSLSHALPGCTHSENV